MEYLKLLFFIPWHWVGYVSTWSLDIFLPFLTDFLEILYEQKPMVQ